jgi:hypothetical protein
MKKILIIGCVALVLFSCKRKKELADTEGATVFGSIKAPCSYNDNQFTLKRKSYLFTETTGTSDYPEYIIRGKEKEISLSITLSQEPTEFPDTISFIKKPNRSIFIKSFSIKDKRYTYSPEYSVITDPMYLYINRNNHYTTFQICNLPLKTVGYMADTIKFSMNISIKN